jgi:hypothetical protein
MPDPNRADVWLQSPLLLALALVGLLILLYLGRSAAHRAIRALAHAVHGALHGAARSLVAAQERLVQRNREVLLSMGQQTTERLIEREFHRVNAVVARDLVGYPALHRKLSDQIACIEEDYRESTEVPPSPPEWIKAVDTVARIPAKGDPFVGRILQDIHKTIAGAHKTAMTEYRKSSQERHRLLRKMLPFWRRLDRTLGRVDETIRGIEERSEVIDQQMDRYHKILSNSDGMVRVLSASSMTHFVTSVFVLLIAVLGAFINFHLIALPMSEMVGAANYVGPVRTSDVAALVIIFTEIAMGLFLMESLRITRLFPVISTLDDKMRRRMIWVSGGILLTLACVESSLAYMRDLLAADREALTQSLAGIQVAQAELRWIPSMGQMVLGFMLPFALTFVAIPLESFIHSSRTVLGATTAALMRTLAAIFRIAGDATESLGHATVHLYDLVIVAPLKVEELVSRRNGGGRTEHAVLGERTTTDGVRS